MSVKVFCNQATVQGYQTDPAGAFRIFIDFQIFTDSGYHSSNSVTLDIPGGTTGYEVYALVYQRILSDCEAAQIEAPKKSDVFGYLPTPFDVLLPDLPSFA